MATIAGDTLYYFAMHCESKWLVRLWKIATMDEENERIETQELRFVEGMFVLVAALCNNDGLTPKQMHSSV